MIKGALTRIIDFSAVDGPGNRMVVFLQGCNLDCAYCHNPETLLCAGEGAETDGVVEAGSGEFKAQYRWVTVSDILARYRKARDFISGVTFSGGECTLQAEFLIACCTALKEQGAHLLLDTNGLIPPTALQRLKPVVDGFMLDIKAVDPAVHRQLTGCDNSRILQVFQELLEEGMLAEVRTVLLDGPWGSRETVAWVSERLGSLSPQTKYRLISYRPHGVRARHQAILTPPSNDLIADCRSLAVMNGVQILNVL